MAEKEPKLWELLVQLLPDHDHESEWWTIREIAPLVGIKPRALMKHAQDLWPNQPGHYRLNYGQAVSLIRRVVLAGRKLPSRESVERQLNNRKAVH